MESQRGVIGSRVGNGDGWGRGVVVGKKCRQLYLNNNKIYIYKICNKYIIIKYFSTIKIQIEGINIV